MPGIVHFWGPYPYRSAFHSTSPEEERVRALQHVRDVLMVEGPHTVAAVILETVVGTNGVLVPPPGYLAGVRELCDEHGIVFVADEIQSGFARTGRMFAIEHAGVETDLVTMAKSLAGGLPLAGVVGTAEIMDAPAAGGLGGTYAGNPLAVVTGAEDLSTEQMQRLRSEFGVYGLDSGRLCVAGLNEGNLDYACRAIASVM